MITFQVLHFSSILWERARPTLDWPFVGIMYSEGVLICWRSGWEIMHSPLASLWQSWIVVQFRKKHTQYSHNGAEQMISKMRVHVLIQWIGTCRLYEINMLFKIDLYKQCTCNCFPTSYSQTCDIEFCSWQGGSRELKFPQGCGCTLMQLYIQVSGICLYSRM